MIVYDLNPQVQQFLRMNPATPPTSESVAFLIVSSASKVRFETVSEMNLIYVSKSFSVHYKQVF